MITFVRKFSSTSGLLNLDFRGIVFGEFTTNFGDDWKKKLAEANLDPRVKKIFEAAEGMGGITDLTVGGPSLIAYGEPMALGNLFFNAIPVLGGKLVEKHPGPIARLVARH